MIRRDDGGDWIIIEQIKHANLAAEIARAWGNEQFEPLARWVSTSIDRSQLSDDEQRAWSRARGAFAHAVSHHDDGWSAWDWAPRIDPRTGMPRDFREMRMRDATTIWTKSISAAAKRFPLSGYAVSRHFCYLAEQVRSGGRHDPEDLAAVNEFLERQTAVQAKLDQRAELHGRGEDFRRHRDLAYRTVQFFDRVSLWLCCADEREPQDFPAPMGELVTFSSRPTAPVTGPSASSVYRLETARPDFQTWCAAIDPYPLSDDAHEFRVDGRRIRARSYADDADLQATWNEAPHVQLVWALTRR
jgi:hypothetical protein